MIKLRDDHKVLVEGFSEDKKAMVQEMLIKEDRHMVSYGVLLMAIDNIIKLINFNADTVQNFYSAPLSELTFVDYVVADIILRLEKEFPDVKETYLAKMSLDPSQPEITYLTELVTELVNK